MDTDVSHEVEKRLSALEEKVGIGGEEKEEDEVEETEEDVDAEEEAD